MTKTLLPITIPASEPPLTEKLWFTTPSYLAERRQKQLRDLLLAIPAGKGRQGSPLLISFSGDTFLEDFLTLAAGRASMPPLLPWRDWCEPPTAMLRPDGRAAYPLERIRRDVPLGLEPPKTLPLGLDADGIPRATANEPPWLRKLYLPQHERFTLVACELICQAAGWPSLKRSRVLAAGMVVRRLRPEPLAGGQGEIWEDWIAGEDKQGSWLELFGEAMQPLGAPGSAGSGVEPVGIDPADVRGLSSHPLAQVPTEAGEAGQQCSLYGYLPVLSAERQRSGPNLETERLKALKALADRTDATLKTLFADPALLRPPTAVVRELLERTVLPPRPDAPTLNQARQTALKGLTTAGIPPGNLATSLDQALGSVLLGVLRELSSRALSGSLTDSDIDGKVLDGPGLWTASYPRGESTLQEPFLGSAKANGTAWQALVAERLHGLLDLWLEGKQLPAAPAELPEQLLTLLAASLARGRGARLALAAAINLHLLGDQRAEDLKAIDGPRARSTLAGLGGSVEAFLAMEKQRTAGSPLAWKPFVPPGSGEPQQTLILDIHERLQTLEEHGQVIGQRLAEAGAAVPYQLLDKANAVEASLKTHLSSSAALVKVGLDLLEQPALSLLVLPGIRPEQAQLDAFRQAAVARYQPLAPSQDLALPEAMARQQAQSLRFDPDHLYAVWCWVRVAGRTACEPARVIWSSRSEPFSIAEPTDLLGARPATIAMPDVHRLLRDLPRLAKAGANPFAALVSPAASGITVGEEMKDTRRDMGLGFVCSFGIPVLTICALVLFNIIFSILILIPGFTWMLFLKLCIPYPKRVS